MSQSSRSINIDCPLWDPRTFIGRFRHYLWVTDPRTSLQNDCALIKAKELVEQYRRGRKPPGTTTEQVIQAKKLYEGAFHPDNCELQNRFGRMSFQVPGGMLLTAGMLTYRNTASGIIFWQLMYQSFYALTNYTNRNATVPVSNTELGIAYVSATACSLLAIMGCKWLSSGPSIIRSAFPTIGCKYPAQKAPFRCPTACATPAPCEYKPYVPFVAVALANCVNVPLMRQNELICGIEVTDRNGKKLGRSRIAAIQGISQVAVSRIVMATPAMLLAPIITRHLESYEWLRCRGWRWRKPLHILLVGGLLWVMVPVACALFPQRSSICTSTIAHYDPEEYKEIAKVAGKKNVPNQLYFNKGL